MRKEQAKGGRKAGRNVLKKQTTQPNKTTKSESPVIGTSDTFSCWIEQAVGAQAA